MQESTTVRVAKNTRDRLRDLADIDGVTLDEEVHRLVRAERQRRMGRALSAAQLDDEDRSWLEVATDAVRDDARR